MKKILAFLLCLSLSIFLVSCGGGGYGMGRAKKADLDTPLESTKGIADLLTEYVGSGQYTKLTTLKYSEDAANYHAGANARQRRTYYDESEPVNALLMGNYDGTFGPINSGYAKVGSDMWHYSHNLEEISTSNLFDQEKMNHNYTVQATSPNVFFDNLSALADAAEESGASRWDLTDGVYTYTAVEPAVIQEGSYSNGLLKVFQYFAAPMLLLNNGIGLQKITVEEIDTSINNVITRVLLIKLFDSKNAEISEAMVVKGLTMYPVLTSVTFDASQITQYCDLSNNNPSLGDTITITPKGNYIISELLNGSTPLVVKGDGTVELTITGNTVLSGTFNLPADAIDVDLVLESSLYGTPDHFWVEDNRDVTVYAAKGTQGVYVYVIAHTNSNVDTDPEWHKNHNFEFKINQGAQMFIASDGQTGNIGEHQISVVQLSEGDFSGKYEHRYEFFVPKERITGWSLDGELEFGYAYKAIGEPARHEGMSNNEWYDNYWQTTTSAINARMVFVGSGETHPGYLHVGQLGLVDRSPKSTQAVIDANLSEYDGKASITLGNNNAKFIITGFIGSDGLYLAIKAYQINLHTPVENWCDNDNLEIKYGAQGINLKFSIFDKFIVTKYDTETAMSRNVLESGEMYNQGYRYETIIEYFIPGLGANTLQFGCNGFGFGGWQSLLWDGVAGYIDETGVYSNTSRYTNYNGMTLDGALNESAWTSSILSKSFTTTANGSRITVRGFMNDAHAAVLAITVEHNKSDDTIIQNNGTAWWHYSGPELRLNLDSGNDMQIAATTWNNTGIGQIKFGYNTVDAGAESGADYRYTTTYEIYLPGPSIATANQCNLVIGGVWDNGFAWLFNGTNPAFRITADGLVQIY